MKSNIYLAYLLAACKNSWFWLGIWIFYYLSFTNYAGIGIIETVLITTMTIAEIPTGAIADLLGKRKTLFASFLLQTVGAFWMAVTPDFIGLALSVFLMGIGATLYSGTLEAFVYDTLKQDGEEDRYDRIISTIGSIHLLTPAICGAIGGFLYLLSPRLPFLANAGFYVVGTIGALFFREPVIDTVKFSFKNYFTQTKQGFKQLVKTAAIKQQTILLLSIGVIVVILDEMLNSFLGVEFGFQATSIGIIWGVIYIVAAFASQLTPYIKKWLGEKIAVLAVGGLLALMLLVAPVLGLVLGGISLIFSSSLQSVYNNLSSIAINKTTESKYRATTLSTFNMFKNIPYVLCAYFVGSLSDHYSARNAAFVLGVILLGLLSVQILSTVSNKLHTRTRLV
ncbi:MFS transporter [Candidatus Woesebacteria bacterium]|nr:MFS transporter [Candidatus Woesebacteria bacterium]